MWTDTFDAFFFITLAGVLLAAFKYGVDYCSKSKCSDCQFCCLKIHREVQVEADIETATLQARAAGVVVPEPVAHEAAIPAYNKRRQTV